MEGRALYHIWNSARTKHPLSLSLFGCRVLVSKVNKCAFPSRKERPSIRLLHCNATLGSLGRTWPLVIGGLSLSPSSSFAFYYKRIEGIEGPSSSYSKLPSISAFLWLPSIEASSSVKGKRRRMRRSKDLFCPSSFFLSPFHHLLLLLFFPALRFAPAPPVPFYLSGRRQLNQPARPHTNQRNEAGAEREAHRGPLSKAGESGLHADRERERERRGGNWV